ncbi:MAG: EAL domain-containing protein [Paracoccaceae bacterium]
METEPHHFTDLARALSSGAGLLARDGTVLSLGPGLAAAFGTVGATGGALTELIAEGDRGALAAALESLRAGPETRLDIALTPRAAAGFDGPVRLTLVALQDRGETVAIGLETTGAGAAPAGGAASRHVGRRPAGCLAGSCPTDVQNAHDRLNALADTFPGALFEFNVSPGGGYRFPYTSARFAEITGVARESYERDGLAVVSVFDPQDILQARAAAGAAARDGVPFRMELRIAHPSKGLRWLMNTATPTPEEDGSTTWFGTLLDVTEQKVAERRALAAAEALAQAHARLTFLTDGVTVGLFEARMDRDGRVTLPYTSARFLDLTGHTGDEIDGFHTLVLDRIEPADRARVQEAIACSYRDRTPVHLRFRLRHPERGTLWLEASAGAPVTEADAVTWVAALHDVTTDVKREHDLREAHRLAETMRVRNEAQALHDGLTGLPNRRFFDDMIAQRSAEAQAGAPRDCTLVRLDLDRFKHVNDTLGHAAGDKVLMRVAEVLRDCVRAGDFPSRNGGDEFSILMAPGASAAEAHEVVDRVQRALAVPLIHDGRQCRFGVSFGIAHTDDLLDIGDDIHLFADAALHRAKVEGGNRTETFTPRLRTGIQRDRNLAIALHEALENDELVPYFQPQVRAGDGSLYGAEVLLRWNHPTEGTLAPGAFMHVAERLRLVPDIDRIVMEKSRDVIARWRAQGLVVPKISLNVSAGRMHDPSILEFAAKFAEIDTRLTFELLESILVEEENQAFRDNLATIRAAGVEIEIDDFGSGHASIIGLMEIEPSALKIDQRIVFPVVHEQRARDLVRAIVQIAAALGIRTVAEGVETADHVRILRALGCEVLQGYHFARPLSEAQFLAYAQAGHASGA